MTVTKEQLQAEIDEVTDSIRNGAALSPVQRDTLMHRRNSLITELGALELDAKVEHVREHVAALIAVGFARVSAERVVLDLCKKHAKKLEKVAMDVQKIVQDQTNEAEKKNDGGVLSVKNPEPLSVSVTPSTNSKAVQAVAPADGAQESAEGDTEAADWGDDEIVAPKPATPDGQSHGTQQEGSEHASASEEEWTPPVWTPEQQKEIDGYRDEYGRKLPSLVADRDAADKILAEMLYIERRMADVKREHEIRMNGMQGYADYLDAFYGEQLKRFGLKNLKKGAQYCPLASGRLQFTTKQGQWVTKDKALLLGELKKLPEAVRKELGVTVQTVSVTEVGYGNLDVIYAYNSKLEEPLKGTEWKDGGTSMQVKAPPAEKPKKTKEVSDEGDKG